jgi:hypothetical protein
VAAVKGLNAWFVRWKSLPFALAVSQDTIKFAPQPGGSVIGPLGGMRAQGSGSDRVTLWQCPPPYRLAAR